MFKTSSLKFMRDPISTIAANGSGHATDNVLRTPSIWKRVTNWLHTMDTNAKLSIFLAWFSRATDAIHAPEKHQYEEDGANQHTHVGTTARLHTCTDIRHNRGKVTRF